MRLLARYIAQMKEPSRRGFLTVLGGSALAGTALACSGQGGAGPEPFGDVSAGNLRDLPTGTLKANSGSAQVAIGRDDAGVYALTLTCTHQACNMAVQGRVDFRGISCTCHGSLFSNNGDVLSGPANAPLQHFAVSIDAAGDLTIHGGQFVAASLRTAVT